MNIFDNLATSEHLESVTSLLQTDRVRIERIVSSGHTTPENAPYCQENDEWVLVLQGHACLKLESRVIELQAGDSCFIPAHTKHWVTYTSMTPEVIWLAVHLFHQSEKQM